MVRLDANDDAIIENHIVYDSFGNIESQTDSTETVGDYFYTGQEYDAETGLYYYNARYYDANTGRFISQDPMSFDAGDTNLYRYVGNNPMTNVDPTGLCSSSYTGMMSNGYDMTSYLAPGATLISDYSNNSMPSSEGLFSFGDEPIIAEEFEEFPNSYFETISLIISRRADRYEAESRNSAYKELYPLSFQESGGLFSAYGEMDNGDMMKISSSGSSSFDMFLGEPIYDPYGLSKIDFNNRPIPEAKISVIREPSANGNVLSHSVAEIELFGKYHTFELSPGDRTYFPGLVFSGRKYYSNTNSPTDGFVVSQRNISIETAYAIIEKFKDDVNNRPELWIFGIGDCTEYADNVYENAKFMEDPHKAIGDYFKDRVMRMKNFDYLYNRASHKYPAPRKFD